MKTPYLDQEIEVLEKGLKDKTNSFYQNRKLSEYKELKKQLRIDGVSKRLFVCEDALSKINNVMWRSFMIKGKEVTKKDHVKIMEQLEKWADD